MVYTYSKKRIEKTDASFGANTIGANTNNENGKTGAGEKPTHSLLLSEITQGDYFTKSRTYQRLVCEVPLPTYVKSRLFFSRFSSYGCQTFHLVYLLGQKNLRPAIRLKHLLNLGLRLVVGCLIMTYKSGPTCI